MLNRLISVSSSTIKTALVMARSLIFVLLIFPVSLFAQTRKTAVNKNNPATILWKVTGKDCKATSYILGTNHLIGADWLYTIPEVLLAIDSSEVLLNEAFTTDQSKAFSHDADSLLKAVSILSKEQFHTLDSFFVARVGEGIINNPDAEELSVLDMILAIHQTLYTDKDGNPIAFTAMDSDLFNLFKLRGRTAIALDNPQEINFGKTDLQKAKAAISPIIEYIKLDRKSEFVTSDTNSFAGKVFNSYKQMKIEYKLDENAPTETTSVVNRSVERRNLDWLPAIKTNISKHSCLIAVGFKHLWYMTGLVGLLRKEGYTVEPVEIKANH